jgi:hypothetical protein
MAFGPPVNAKSAGLFHLVAAKDPLILSFSQQARLGELAI